MESIGVISTSRVEGRPFSQQKTVIFLRLEALSDFGFGSPLRLEGTIAVAAFDGRIHDGIGLGAGDVVKWPHGIGLLPIVKHFLKVGQVLVYRLFGIALHPGIERGVYPQPVPGKGIRASVRFADIFEVLGDDLADVFAEILRDALRMGLHPEVGLERERTKRIQLLLGEHAVALHLPQDRVAPRQGIFRVADRIVQDRVLGHPHEGCRFLDGQFRRQFVEIGERGIFDPVRIVEKIVRIEIHRDDLVLGVAAFELRSDDPFLEFLDDALYLVLRSVFGKELFGQLLGERTGSAPTSQENDRAHRRAHVDARMLAETLVLGRDQRIDQVGREFLELDRRTVFVFPDLPDGLPIGRDDLRGYARLGVFDVLEGRQLAEYPFFDQEKQ